MDEKKIIDEKKIMDEVKQLKRIQNLIDGTEANYREEIETELTDIDVAYDIFHKKSVDEIYNTIHTYPVEDKDRMYSLITAFYILKKANGDLEKADSLLDEFRKATKTFYLYKMDIYDLYCKQLKIEEEIKNL